MRGRNGGGCDRPRPFSIIAILAVVVLTKCRGSTVTKLLHWYYAVVLGALSSWPMMSGEGLLPCLGRHSLFSFFFSFFFLSSHL